MLSKCAFDGSTTDTFAHGRRDFSRRFAQIHRGRVNDNTHFACEKAYRDEVPINFAGISLISHPELSALMLKPSSHRLQRLLLISLFSANEVCVVPPQSPRFKYVINNIRIETVEVH